MGRDGYKGYGTMEVHAAPLTIDEARKYAEVIPDCDDPTWLVTGWGGPGHFGEALVLIVQSNGDLRESYANDSYGIRPAWGSVCDFFKGIWDGIVNVFQGVVDWFASIFSDAWEAIKGVFATVGEFFQGVWDTIVGLFTSIGTAVSDAISGAVKGAINAVLSGAIGIINGFISAINAAVSVINAIPGVKIKKIAKLESPRLAKGGYVGPNKPQPVIIGDNRNEGEIVSPISKMRDTVISALRQFKQSNKGDGSKLGEIKGFLSSAVQTLVKAAKPTGALQTLHGETSNRTINQTVTINNKFEGDKAIQRDASKAMDKSAKDVTSELARGLAYAK